MKLMPSVTDDWQGGGITFYSSGTRHTSPLAAMVTLSIGMEILAEEEVRIDSLTGHGGLFKTPVVGQRLLAAALETPITVMAAAGEGGPWGMALLAAFVLQAEEDETLEDFLNRRVFATQKSRTLYPNERDVLGFHRYAQQFKRALPIERLAVELL